MKGYGNSDLKKTKTMVHRNRIVRTEEQIRVGYLF